MSADSTPTNNPHIWFIGLGIAATVLGGWYALGQAGTPTRRLHAVES